MKYIIDIPNEMAEATARYWNETTDMTLVPYTEPDLNPLVDEAVETIENEVWEFALCTYENMTEKEFDECYNGWPPLTYQEAKTKYEAWKEEKNKICVGDEVTFEMAFGNGLDNNMKAVALDQAATGEEWCVLTENGCIETHDEEDLYKTGRHFDEVGELLKKMRGNND